MTEMLHWPFRILLYVFLYMGWTIISLVLLASFPVMNGFAAMNLLIVGWLSIGAVFASDIYFTQLRGKKP